MQLENLPIIDWESATRLAGNKRDIAEEILGMLIKNLPQDIAAINESWEEKNYWEMSKHLHKLHGALCYCGLPRLKTVVAQLEMDIKKDLLDGVPMMVDVLNDEVKLLMNHT
jgi:two-component system sensor histidine kinase BarA